MAKVITNVDDAIEYLNSLLELDDEAPAEGDEDYTLWLSLLNIATNLWESEEGILWKELFVKLQDASSGDKTTDGSNSYDCPDDFVFPASGYVWIGSGTNKIPYKVVPIQDVQLLENDRGNWCYFVQGANPTLEFNPNITLDTGSNIHYNYYKSATKLEDGDSTFEMSDPLFAVYYALSELTKEEGNQGALTIATQKLEGMKTKNLMPTWFEDDNRFIEEGFGI